MTAESFLQALGLTGLIVILLGLLILWIAISIPVYGAAKIVTRGRATFGTAMGATLLGPVVYLMVLFGAGFLLSAAIGWTASIFALLLAFLAWLGVYKSMFQTGWLGALAIAILAAVLFLILALVVAFLLALVFPGTPFPTPPYSQL